MKLNFSLKAKLYFILTPLFIGVAIFGAATVYRSFGDSTQAKHLSAAVEYYKKASDTIHEMQKERGKSGLYLAKKLSQQDLDVVHTNTDKKIQSVKAYLDSTKISEGVENRFNEFNQQLTQARKQVEAFEAAPVVIAGYSKSIESLIRSQVAASETASLNSLETKILSLTILEKAKENMGKLRAKLSNILANNQPISSQDLVILESFRSGILSNLESPALIASPESIKKIRDVLETTEWKAILSSLEKVMHKSSEGNYGEDSVKFFEHITKLIDQVKSIINEEATYVENKISDVGNSTRKTAWTVLLFAAFGLIFVSFTSFKTVSGVVHKLTDVSTGITQSAESVGKTSSKIGEASESLSAAATEQAAAMQETVASVDEIRAMIGRNADHSNQSKELAAKALAEIETGKISVSGMTQAINEIVEGTQAVFKQMEENQNQLNDLVTMIKEIGSKTSVINDIVFQTKLLSFNASVEAARAGEMGKGFSVVADEISKLANHSGKAAKEIEGLLVTSTSRVETIVKTTQEKVTQVVKSNQAKTAAATSSVKECEGIFQKIYQRMGDLDQMMIQIATASKEQAAGVGEVNKALGEINTGTHQTSISAQECASASSELVEQSQVLNQCVNKLVESVFGGSSANDPETSNVVKLPDEKTRERAA